jgi:hypothetical protein
MLRIVQLNRYKLKQWSLGIMNQPRVTSSQSRLSLLTLIFILTLTMLACAYMGNGERSASATIRRLPTLTRTPLPTLTPTGAATPAAVAAAAEQIAPAPTQAATTGSPVTASQIDPANPPAPANPQPHSYRNTFTY